MDEAFASPPCKHCGHDASHHDEEFGNCTALIGRYVLENWDGCDCPGYEEGAWPVLLQRSLQ
jgi:hypothetical protein